MSKKKKNASGPFSHSGSHNIMMN